jgi:hypothetical protein
LFKGKHKNAHACGEKQLSNCGCIGIPKRVLWMDIVNLIRYWRVGQGKIFRGNVENVANGKPQCD